MTRLVLDPPETVVVHCIDPRFQRAFADFIENYLKLEVGEYIPLVVPGSVVGIGSGISALLPKNFKILSEQFQMIFRNQKPKRVVLINHEDCRGYSEIAQKLKSFIRFGLSQKQVDDLQFAARVVNEIARRFVPECKIEMYMARIRPDQEVVFEEILTEKMVWPAPAKMAVATPA